MSTPLPVEILRPVGRGKVWQLARWLRKGGSVDALCSGTSRNGRATATHVAAACGYVEMARMLLKRGASVDLQSSFGSTALMAAVSYAKAYLVNFVMAAWLSLCLCVALCAVLSLAYGDWRWMAASFSPLGIAALRGMQAAWADAAKLLVGEAAEQATAHARSKRSKKKKLTGRAAATGDAPSKAPHTAAPALPPATVPKHAASAAEWAEAATEAVRLAAAEQVQDEAEREARQEAAAEAARLAEVLRAAVAKVETYREAGREREARREAAANATRLAAVDLARESEAREAVRVMECKAKLEAAQEAAPEASREWQQRRQQRLAEGERAREATAREAVRVAAASKARAAAEEATAAAVTAAEAATAAAAKADVLERAMADGGEGNSSRAVGPSEASEVVEVPDDYICPITAEIMTDPVSTMDGFTYERTAITEWLRTNNTSPFTGATLESKALIPNLLVRSLLRAFIGARTAPSTASP